MHAKTPFYFRGRKTPKPPHHHAQVQLRLALTTTREDWDEATDADILRIAQRFEVFPESCEFDQKH